MTERRFEFLRPDEYNAIRKAEPIAYLPWGAHEWHGLHNPLGVDSIKAYRLCLELANKTGGVVLPPVYCGYSTMQRHGQKCTLEFPVELVEQLARHYFTQLVMEGFRVIVAVLGHYGWAHQKAIQNQARQATDDWAHCLRVIAEPDYTWTQPEYPGDHGAANETSYMMAFYPETVDLSKLPPVSDGVKLDFNRDGIGGTDPRTEASADRGRKQLDMLLARAVPQIISALAETRK